MRPILFLDIDGVLNHPGNYDEWSKAKEAEKPLTGFREGHVEKLFDERCVGVLNDITNATGADIVLSSSWRMFYWDKRAELRGLFKRVGIQAKVIDFTPRRGSAGIQRGDEIATWLRTRGVSCRLAVIDDDNDMDAVRPWFVQTDGAVGLHQKNVPDILDRLTQFEPWKK